MRRRDVLTSLSALGGAALIGAPRALAQGLRYQEAPDIAAKVAKGELPPLEKRLPETPLVADFAASGKRVGRYGGALRTLIARTRDLRYLSVNGYVRLVGYDEQLRFVPDLAATFTVDGNQIFTFTLRRGHKWSDGHPFTTEDVRYYWEDIAQNAELNPSGPPEIYTNAGGDLARLEIVNDITFRLTWQRPNPRFLPALAQPQPLPLFAPSHYLRQFHKKYADPKALAQAVTKAKVKSWATLHNRLDATYDLSNPDLPTLLPWRILTAPPASRFEFARNPYFHRVDPEGRQLPYIEQVLVDIASPSLFAAKSNAGEVDLMARGLSMADVPVLKEGEAIQGYRTLLWNFARGSAYALYPNLNAADPTWRALNRDIRFRRALSLAIDRKILNNALLFGLGREGNNTVLQESPLHEERLRTLNAGFDPRAANALLDPLSQGKRDSSGIRRLPNGELMEVVVEVDGDAGDVIDALQLITEFWRDVGVKLFIKPQERSILRQRSWSGQTIMVASTGLDNAVPTASMPPTELAPVRQEHYSWPKWGQWYETAGKVGEEPDLPEARRALELYRTWLGARQAEEAAEAWRALLMLNVEQQFTIGTVSGEIQPVVIRKSLRNLPDKGVYSWEPTSLLGIYRIETLWHET